MAFFEKEDELKSMARTLVWMQRRIEDDVRMREHEVDAYKTEMDEIRMKVVTGGYDSNLFISYYNEIIEETKPQYDDEEEE